MIPTLDNLMCITADTLINLSYCRPVHQLLSHLNPFSQQLYSDYLHYQSAHPGTTEYGPSTPTPYHYGPSSPHTAFYGPSSPVPPHYGPSSPIPHHYGPSSPNPPHYGHSTPGPLYFSDITNTHHKGQPIVHVKHSGSAEAPTTPTPYKYKIITEDKAEPKTDEIELTPPSKGYLPPPPSKAYNSPLKNPVPKPIAPQPKAYLPPPPKDQSIGHNPTIKNLKEVHTLPPLKKLSPKPIFEAPHQPKPFIGPQLPPHLSHHPKPTASQYSASPESRKEVKYSNKDKLEEALKKFNAKPNIDREVRFEDETVVEVINNKVVNEKAFEDLTITSTTSAPKTTTTTRSTTTRSTTSTEKLADLKIEDFIPESELQGQKVINLAAGETNDNFLFGPQTRPKPRSTTASTLTFSSSKPLADNVNDIVLGMNLFNVKNLEMLQAKFLR